MSCRVCHQERELSGVGICWDCHVELGIVLPAAPLRPAVPCARCRATSFVRSWALREVETRTATGLDQPAIGTYFAPLSLALKPGTQSAFWEGPKASSEHSTRIGIIEAYACRQCGFTELYTHGADAIPIGPEFGTELVDLPPPEGPYR